MKASVICVFCGQRVVRQNRGQHLGLLCIDLPAAPCPHTPPLSREQTRNFSEETPMSGARPEQATLTRGTNVKDGRSRAVIEGMVDGLNDHRIADISEFFAEGFRWMGNQGCGTKRGCAHSKTLQKPFKRPSTTRFAWMRRGSTWANGRPPLVAKRPMGATSWAHCLRQTHHHPLHGFLEGRRWQDRRQLRDGRLPPAAGSAGCRCLRW